MAQEKNPEPCLWNIDACRNASTIAITEGEIDALSLMESGWRMAVSVDKGAPQVEDKSVEKKLECVTRCMEILKAAQWVVICSDKDGPVATGKRASRAPRPRKMQNCPVSGGMQGSQ